MTPLALSSWFRARMLPLVVGAALAGALAPPLVYHVQKRHELVASARADAQRVAVALGDLAQQQPRLWRYDTAKLAERLASEGLGRDGRIVVRDAHGVDLPIGAGPPVPVGLWGQAEVVVAGRTEARVWVGVPSRALASGTLALGLLSSVGAVLLGALLYLLPARVLAAAERRIEALMGQLTLSLREEERGRIARDLHDGAGQALTAARLHLVALRKVTAGGPLAPRVEATAQHIDEALDEIRRSTAALRPPALAELGLQGALERHTQAFAEASGLAVSCSIVAPLPPLEAHVETTLYRIAQEALTNAARHANATRVRVRLARERAALVLTIEDDGQGLENDRPGGVGLASITERARLLGGEARLEPCSPGLRIRVTLPVEEQP